MSTEPMTAIRRTRYSHGAGGACKLGPSESAQVLRYVPDATDPRILVDASSRDDAAVFQMAPDRAIVATVDFFTPIVDDPYDFGRIAATNAFSDLYAMGATPLFALNLVGWPRDTLPFELLGGRRTRLEASGAAAEVRAAAVPLLPHAREAAERGAIPGGTERNAAGVAAAVSFAAGVDQTARLLLADAQTSGGLLIAVAAERADMLVAALRREATPAADVIGRVVTGAPGTMTVV